MFTHIILGPKSDGQNTIWGTLFWATYPSVLRRVGREGRASTVSLYVPRAVALSAGIAPASVVSQRPSEAGTVNSAP